MTATIAAESYRRKPSDPGHRGVAARCAIAASALVCALPLVATTPAMPQVALTTKALIMDGTTFPVPSPGFMQSAVDDFIAPAVPDDDGYTATAQWTPERILGINKSVDDGVQALLKSLEGRQGKVVMFGYSQSTVIQMRVKAELQARKDRGEAVPEVTFVGIGVGNRPNGGISSRLVGITIPFFDFTFDGAGPTDTDFLTVDIARQYDGLADFPQFPVNLVATANAVFGVLFVHLLYGEAVSLDPSSPKYVNGTATQQYGDTTYYFVPTANLPLFDPLRLIGVPEKLIDVVEPFVKVLVEAGYDRSIPFGQATPAQLIPVIDPITLGLQLLGAVVEGANNAAKIVGGQLPQYRELTEFLENAEVQSTTVIGAPYRQVVSTLNEYLNPFKAFAAIEGPIAVAIDSVISGLHIPDIINTVIHPVITAVTGWAEKNLLFPQSKSASESVTAASEVCQDSALRAEHVSAAVANSEEAVTVSHREAVPEVVKQEVVGAAPGTLPVPSTEVRQLSTDSAPLALEPADKTAGRDTDAPPPQRGNIGTAEQHGAEPVDSAKRKVAESAMHTAAGGNAAVKPHRLHRNTAAAPAAAE